MQVYIRAVIESNTSLKTFQEYPCEFDSYKLVQSHKRCQSHTGTL